MISLGYNEYGMPDVLSSALVLLSTLHLQLCREETGATM